MAKILGRDPVSFTKERDGFLRDLQHFHETRGTPFRRFPKISGHEIDLYLLYTLVTEQGGWIKVNSKSGWPELFQHFNLPSRCVNGSIALKQIYLRYLDRWEKVHYLGEEADRGSDDDEESRHKRWSARALHSVPTTYNYQQHNIADTSREYNNLSTDLYKPSDYDRLALSLLSSLPNEQDFAINVCTLLSSDGKHTLKLEKHPRILDYLCAHAGVFNHGSLRQLFMHNYSEVRKHNLHTFWNHVVEVEEFLDLTKESSFIKVKKIKPTCSPKTEANENGAVPLGDVTKMELDMSQAELNLSKDALNMSVETIKDASSPKGLLNKTSDSILVDDSPMEVGIPKEATTSATNVPTVDLVGAEEETSGCDKSKSEANQICDSDSDCELFASDEDCVINSIPKGKGFKLKWKSDPSDKELFCLGTTLGTREYIGQRVLQVATILRNLSFIEDNTPTLLKNDTFVRFMLLCASSQWNQLKNLGLDMLGNMAMEYIVKDLSADKLSSFLIKIISKGLESEDRSCCISSLEVLNKLSLNETNEDVLLRSLEARVYEKVCSFLTIHDVMLLIYTLECLYSLSSLGERACNFIVNNHGVIDTLVSLVTVEGKSYGPKACIGMKLVETVTGGGGSVSNVPTSTVQPSLTNTPTISTPAVLTSAAVSSVVMTPVPATPVKTIAPSTPQRPVQIVPQRLIAVSPSPAATPTVVAATPQAAQTISPQQLVQQQHAHQQAIQENEQFALAWIRATYEPCVSGRVDHQELYKHYINSCAKIGRRGVIAPLHFPRCVRSVFGGTVGPNPVKSANSSEPQYYDGIKVRAVPLVISVQAPASTPTPIQTPVTPVKAIRRATKTQFVTAAQPSPSLTVIADNSETPPASPASPILKAQLSAPPKQRETTVITSNKGDTKSQVMAHPHLSQALLGSGTATSTPGSSKDPQAGQSNTSLIKSLLATKVNECMTPVSMRTATDCQSVVQVVARQQQQQQQRLLAQQSNVQIGEPKSVITKVESGQKTCRLNGARQLFPNENDVSDSAVSSTTQGVNTTKSRREPPQPPPPPLAPLSNMKGKQIRLENEDSDSTGNNSLASSTGLGNIGLGGVSSTEDGDNSLTSFEGILLNGIPSIDNPVSLNEDSNSKESLKSAPANSISKNKPLMLADLLEKKVDKDPPTLNGVLGKELRIGDKGLELVENHIDKALKEPMPPEIITIDSDKTEDSNKQGMKRPASDEVEFENKKPHLASNNVNGSADSPAPDSVSSSNGDGEVTGTVSTAAAKLFADIAADILEDEEEELMQQEAAQVVEENNSVQIVQNSGVQQVFVDANQQMMMSQPRLIVSQPQMQATNQMVIPAGAQLKAQPGQTVIVQNSQPRPQMVLQQTNTGQFILPQGQLQLVASGAPGGQYLLQTGGQGYVVAQSQTAVVHGQPQTVLVAQTQQQQGTGTKTIIILQQQPAPSAATHHQKIVVTPQGQQVVVTQVPRPAMQTSSVSNNIIPTSMIKSAATNVISQTNSSNGVSIIEKKKEESKLKPKLVRDLSSPYVCEWGDCQVDFKFTSANQVYLHACEVHCPETMDESICLWDRCDNMKRKRFSLMTHLYDKHCNNEAMKNNLIRRKQMGHSNKVETPTPTSSTPHPGYAPDAALHAIKRHALEFVNPKELQRPSKQGPTVVATPAPRSGPPTTEQDDNEGPVTKSIRLTASLILRNLVIYSGTCRRYLKHYEPHLANVALSNVESSRTIAQVLHDMNDGTNHR